MKGREPQKKNRRKEFGGQSNTKNTEGEMEDSKVGRPGRTGNDRRKHGRLEVSETLLEDGISTKVLVERRVRGGDAGRKKEFEQRGAGVY